MYYNILHISQRGKLMKVETLPVVQGDHNLGNYQEMYKHFDWKETEKEFTWSETGLVNMAYEAIDRHAKTYSEK